MTPEEFREYVAGLKVDERVIETTPNIAFAGRCGTIYISTNPGTAGSKCVMWDPHPVKLDGRMGTSVTHGTRRLSAVLATYRVAEAARGAPES